MSGHYRSLSESTMGSPGSGKDPLDVWRGWYGGSGGGGDDDEAREDIHERRLRTVEEHQTNGMRSSSSAKGWRERCVRSLKFAAGRGRSERPWESSMSRGRREEGYAPIADLPPKDEEDASLKFKYEVDDMMRVVYEGAGVRKIARYNEQKLVRDGWMERKVYKTTFLASAYCWLQIFLLWFLAGLVAVLVYGLLKACGANVKTVEGLQKGLSVSSTIEIFVAFALGTYIKKTIDIWWELRHQTLQELMNVIADMCLRMAIYFPGRHYEDKHARETIMRYGILSLALLFQDAKKVDVWSRKQVRDLGVLDLSDLQREKLLTTREAALLHNVPAKSQMCWIWISSLFTKWCLDGRLPDPLGNQDTMLVYSEQARNAISIILAQLTTQFPLSYSHLIIFFCKVYVTTLAVEAGVTLGSSLLQGQTNYANLVTKSFVLTVSPIVYQGLLELKERVSNPFRNDMQVTSSILQDPTKMKSLTPTPPQQTNTHTHTCAQTQLGLLSEDVPRQAPQRVLWLLQVRDGPALHHGRGPGALEAAPPVH